MAKARKVSLIPHFLFEVNWADSGPGVSWPETFFVIYLPYYHRHVITSSRDTPDVFGYCDLVLKHFDVDKPFLEGSHRILVNEWRRQRLGWDQEKWSWFLESGLVTESMAEEWAAEVWLDVSEEDDEDDDIEWRRGKKAVKRARWPVRWMLNSVRMVPGSPRSRQGASLRLVRERNSYVHLSP